jgi:hypothetical protein
LNAGDALAKSSLWFAACGVDLAAAVLWLRGAPHHAVGEGLTCAEAQRVADAAATLRQKALHDSDIASTATLTGFLFLPFNSYARARVELIDKQSDEAEGFSIEF